MIINKVNKITNEPRNRRQLQQSDKKRTRKLLAVEVV